MTRRHLIHAPIQGDSVFTRAIARSVERGTSVVLSPSLLQYYCEAVVGVADKLRPREPEAAEELYRAVLGIYDEAHMATAAAKLCDRLGRAEDAVVHRSRLAQPSRRVYRNDAAPGCDFEDVTPHYI